MTLRWDKTVGRLPPNENHRERKYASNEQNWHLIVIKSNIGYKHPVHPRKYFIRNVFRRRNSYMILSEVHGNKPHLVHHSPKYVLLSPVQMWLTKRREKKPLHRLVSSCHFTIETNQTCLNLFCEMVDKTYSWANKLSLQRNVCHWINVIQSIALHVSTK